MQHVLHQGRSEASSRERAHTDGFWQAAVHSVTRTTPRQGRRQRLVPWSLAVALLLDVGAAGAAFATGMYWLMWTCLVLVLFLALFGSVTHAWRASTRYKRPLPAQVDHAGKSEGSGSDSTARPRTSPR